VKAFRGEAENVVSAGFCHVHCSQCGAPPSRFCSGEPWQELQAEGAEISAYGRPNKRVWSRRFTREIAAMPAPKTLLAMAGAPAAPPALKDAAIVVIDAQREYVDGKLPLPGVEAALAEIAALLARARAAGSPIVHVRHMGRAGGLFDPAGPGGAIAAPAAPKEGEPVVGKTLPNAFAGTDLAARLGALGRRELVVCGFMTHMCVSSTVRAALDLGYRCTVPAAATATRDLPDPVIGATVPAAALQRASLAALADRFAIVTGGADALR
jgi:nicotinamidase-related amidase